MKLGTPDGPKRINKNEKIKIANVRTNVFNPLIKLIK